MRHTCVRPLSKLTLSLLVSSIVPLALACGSSSDGDEPPSEPPPSSNGAAGSPSPAQPAPSTNNPTPAGPSAEDIAALTEVFGMAADQIQAACGPSFDQCEATPGCNEILACAARSACAGSDCYCVGDGCAMDGPCRSVIDSAPGARVPDATSTSLGPASDAASAVGACLQGLGGGGLGGGGLGGGQPTPAPGGADAGAELDAG
ncbi:MAG TPA: hypothetical protein VMG12_28815 [Polyangiaceae bacterium]|nr:hypothetical protein [Polyangiaceae bacterium]